MMKVRKGAAQGVSQVTPPGEAKPMRVPRVHRGGTGALLGGDVEQKWAGVFIVVEGPDGIGKSTLAAGLARKLCQIRTSVQTSEPTRSAAGAMAREALAAGITSAETPGDLRAVDWQAAALMAADRAHHFKTLILPILGLGGIVVCDRYLPSSMVNQHEIGFESVLLLNLQVPAPDLTIFLTAPPELIAKRLAARSGGADPMERRMPPAMQVELYEHARRALDPRTGSPEGKYAVTASTRPPWDHVLAHITADASEEDVVEALWPRVLAVAKRKGCNGLSMLDRMMYGGIYEAEGCLP